MQQKALCADPPNVKATASSRRPAPRPRRSARSRPQRSRRGLYFGALAAAGVLVVALVVASQLGASKSKPAPAPSALLGVAETSSLFGGIPQNGVTLGDPKAPVTLVEYADLQCPYCADFARNVLPTIVQEYVRPGKVRLVFAGLAFIGPDSETALRASIAAGKQNRLWNFVELLYQNQGGENDGWVTDELLKTIAATVPGLDAGRMLADRSSAAIADQIAGVQSHADEVGINSTPSFELGRTGGPLVRLDATALDPAQLRAALDRLIAR